MPAIKETTHISETDDAEHDTAADRDIEALKTELVQAASDLENSPPQEVLRWAVERFRPSIVVACSFGGLQTMAVIHMLSEMNLLDDVEVFFNDTGVLFPETHQTRLRAQERYGFRAKRVEPTLAWDDQQRMNKGHLYERGGEGIDKCCDIRKVKPVKEYLAKKDAWITGMRRSHGKTREQVPVVMWDALHGLAKVNPVATMDDSTIEGYVKANAIPYNTLYDRGYKSIGCNTPICTRPVKEGEDPRAGRWAGMGKTECGLHLNESQVKSLDSSKL